MNVDYKIYFVSHVAPFFVVGHIQVTKQRIKTLKLSEITRPLDEESQSNMMKAAVMRILKAERDAVMGGILTVRNKVLTILAATFKKDVRQGKYNNKKAYCAFPWQKLH